MHIIYSRKILKMELSILIEKMPKPCYKIIKIKKSYPKHINIRS